MHIATQLLIFRLPPGLLITILLCVTPLKLIQFKSRSSSSQIIDFRIAKLRKIVTTAVVRGENITATKM